jgi:alpha-methylacyl-CoA racemase
MTWSLRGAGAWSGGRGENLLDSGAPFYDTYECADGRYVAVGALEPQFYAQLVTGLGLTDLPDQQDRPQWPVLRERFTAAFRSRPREHWLSVFDGTDACVTPVLTWDEVPADEHIRERATVIELDGVPQAAPAPRFSRTCSATPQSPRRPGQDTADVVRDWLGPEPEGA